MTHVMQIYLNGFCWISGICRLIVIQLYLCQSASVGNLVLQNFKKFALCIFDLHPQNDTHSIELIPLLRS